MYEYSDSDIKFRFDNSLSAPPGDKSVAVNSLKYINTNESGDRDTILIENSQFLNFNLKYGNSGASFYRRPPYSYSIKFASEPIYEVARTVPPTGCSDNPGNTLLPFQITNITTGKVVGVYHTDKGTHYKDLEPGKWVKLGGWENAEHSAQLIKEAIERAST